MNVRLAAASEVDEALDVLFAAPGVARPLVERQRSALLAAEARGQVDLSGLFVAERQATALAACLAIVLPGRVAVLTPPQGNIDEPTAQRLLRRCQAWCRRRGVLLLQAIVDPQETVATQRLIRSGCELLSRLVFLGSKTDAMRHRITRRAPIDWRTCAELPERALESIIERTYEDSLDCPGLNATRSIEDIVASHKAEAVFDPRLWLLAHSDGRPVGCLLLGPVPSESRLELIYMGVVPEARGRGIGAAFVAKTVDVADSLGADLITLAVDEQNSPARALYRSVGFREAAIRAVYGKLLQNPTRNCQTLHTPAVVRKT